jgi:hypothetical protein
MNWGNKTICSLLMAISSMAYAQVPAWPEVSPEQVVASLYREHAWEVLFDTSEPAHATDSLLLQDAEKLSQYFAPELVQLLAQDRACQQRVEGICNLSRDPIWASQDPVVAALRVDAGPAPHTVQVSFLNPLSKRQTLLIYVMTHTGQGWRIADIRYTDTPSLQQILLRPVKG